jgi:hypothetical protein
MKKVAFVGGWGEAPAAMMKRYAQQTPGGRGVWEDVIGVETPQEADYLVVMDRTPKDMDLDSLPWDRVIYFEREPHQAPWMDRQFPSNMFFDGSYTKLHNVPTWWINVPFDDLVAMPYPAKTKKLSCVNSGLYSHIEEHRLRVEFLHRFTQETQAIDVWGRGIGRFIHPATYRGELNYNGNCKLRGFIDHEYALVLENVRLPNTWSEKICDPLLAWCVPIYWGASNIDYFFPKGSYHALPRELTGVTAATIAEITSQPVDVEALRQARHDLLFKWNIWPTIKRIIDGQPAM